MPAKFKRNMPSISWRKEHGDHDHPHLQDRTRVLIAIEVQLEMVASTRPIIARTHKPSHPTVMIIKEWVLCYSCSQSA